MKYKRAGRTYLQENLLISFCLFQGKEIWNIKDFLSLMIESSREKNISPCLFGIKKKFCSSINVVTSAIRRSDWLKIYRHVYSLEFFFFIECHLTKKKPPFVGQF